MNLDTRNKILSPLAAAEWARRLRSEGKSVAVACGFFDPLLAAHAARLERLASGGSPMLAVVTDPPDPILPLAARAELVAALGVVDAVAAIPPAELEAFLASLNASAIQRGEAEDAALRQDLIQHVHKRQRAS